MSCASKLPREFKPGNPSWANKTGQPIRGKQNRATHPGQIKPGTPPRASKPGNPSRANKTGQTTQGTKLR